MVDPSNLDEIVRYNNRKRVMVQHDMIYHIHNMYERVMALFHQVATHVVFEFVSHWHELEFSFRF